jgi:PAS domain S-box-containing protein
MGKTSRTKTATARTATSRTATSRTATSRTATSRTATAQQRRLEALVDGQSQLLDMISQGRPLSQILDAIIVWVEAQASAGVLASILLLDAEGQRLRHGAAPSLPDAYNAAIDGIAIGPCAGSCGTAAYTRATVVVSDIERDPLWADHRDLALAHGLRACWSTPLIARDSSVLGTFAMYYRRPRVPTPDDTHVIQLVARTAVLAIEHTRAEEERERLRLRERLALLQAETERQRLRNLFTQAPAQIAVLRGPTHVFELANPLYLHAVGKDSEILGKPIREALPELAGQGFYELLDHVYASGEPYVGREVAVKLERGEGGAPEDLYVNLVYQPSRDVTGTVDGILVHAVDVTELVRSRQRVEESEERFRTLADNMPQLAWMADETGGRFWYNRNWYEYTGTTPAEMMELKGWGWRTVHHPEHVERVESRFRAYIASGEPWEDTFPLRGKDGTYRWFLSRAVPVRDASGRIVRWFGTNTDVTERRRLDQQKDDFISIASHELKTPVTSLKVSAQLLAHRFRAAGDARNAELLEKMDRQLNRMTKLIGDMVDQTRIERGKLQMEMAPFEFAALLGEVVEDVQRTATSHLIVSEGAPKVTLNADRQRISQVLTNLLTNAVKYSPEANRVEIRSATEGDRLVTRVRDFGIGIPEEKQAHVFDRYFRVSEEEGGERESFPGMGLGLYISAEIVRQHGGRIWVESEEGVGSTFAFSLPLARG